MCHQCLAVHQEGFGMGQTCTQLIKDGKTMGINVAPVVDAALVEPRGLGQHLKPVPGAEDDYAVPQVWKGQKVDLVFSDKYTVDL